MLAASIGARLRRARQRAGLTQQQVAGDRYTKAYVSALEHGTAKPSMGALTFLAERLSIAPAELLHDVSPGWTRLEADLELAAGNWEPAADAYEELLRVETDRKKRAELLRGRAEALCRLDRGGEAISAASEAVDLFTRLGREGDAALASYWLAFALYERENSDEAKAILRGLLERVRSGLAVEPDLTVRLLVALSVVESRAGQHRTAVTYLEEARGLAVDLDDRRRASFLFSLAISYRETGDIEGAIRTGTEALALFRAAGAALEVASIENDLALAYLALGNVARARAYVSEAHAQFSRLGDDRWLAHVTETEAQIALAQDDTEAALALAATAIAHAEASQNNKALTSALLTQGKAHARRGEPDAAETSFERAASIARERGSTGQLREVLSEWAAVLAERGDHARAYRLARAALSGDADTSVQPSLTGRAVGT